MFRAILLAALLGIFSVASAQEMMEMTPSPSMECPTATYTVTFRNLLTNRRFGDMIPEGGLVFSPLAGVSHSNRQSFLTIRGFASRTVETIAETGSNGQFLSRARRLRRRGEGVLSVVGASGPTMPGRKTELTLDVDCNHTFVTVLGMIAPGPDWIVQINNRNLYNKETGMFVDMMSGELIAYDAGTDSGREFTNPGDPSLDIPTEPKLNIAPLVEDETDRFDGRIVGRWFIQKME